MKGEQKKSESSTNDSSFKTVSAAKKWIQTTFVFDSKSDADLEEILEKRSFMYLCGSHIINLQKNGSVENQM